MNCKQGDLAVVVGSIRAGSKNIGKIVKCIRFVEKGTVLDGLPGPIANDSWIVDVDQERYLTSSGAYVGNYPVCSDRFLRPLRDNEGEDETLTWAGKPEKVKS